MADWPNGTPGTFLWAPAVSCTSGPHYCQAVPLRYAKLVWFAASCEYLISFASARYKDKKLSWRREITRQFVSLNMLLKSFNITQGHSKWHCWVGRKSVLVFHCNYLVPFLRYSASKNRVTLKLGVGVVQGHWKWCRSIVGLYDFLLVCRCICSLG